MEELQDAGYNTIDASSGSEGMSKIYKYSPDLILCDITMIDMDGYQVLTELRQSAPEYANTKFIFISALADRKNIIVGKARGGDDYITKPIDFELLLVTIAAHLRQPVQAANS